MKLLISLKKRVYCQGRAERVCLAAFREALLNAAAPQASPGERKGPGPGVGTALARTGPGQERGDLLLEDVCKKLGCSERGLSAAHPPRACRVIGEGARHGTRALLEVVPRRSSSAAGAGETRLQLPVSLQGLFPTQALKAVGPLLLASAQNRLNVFYISMTIHSLHFLGRRKHTAHVPLQSARSDTSVSALKPSASIPFAAHVSAASPVFPCSVLTPFKKIIIMEACCSPASFPKQPCR